MDFIVSDRETVERGLLVRNAYVLISIRDPDKRPVRVPRQPGLRAVLSLAFHDAEPAANQRRSKTIRLMSESQAREIWTFVHRHAAEVKTIVVHCEQGMSRSPAVAAAIRQGMGGDCRRFFREYQPNRYIYELMARGINVKRG